LREEPGDRDLRSRSVFLANGIEVTAIHSHMLTEQPRVFLVHFWANDDALKLAKGVRAALEKKQQSPRADGAWVRSPERAWVAIRLPSVTDGIRRMKGMLSRQPQRTTASTISPLPANGAEEFTWSGLLIDMR